MPLRSVLLALLITFIWGINFVVIKLSVAHVSPLLVAALRFALAAFPAVFFVPRPQIATKFLVVYGLTSGVMQFGLLYLAIQMGVSAGLASLMMQMQVFLTALLAATFLHEKLLPNQLLGMLLAFAGMVTIGLLADHHANLLGLGLIVLAATGWALSNVLIKGAGNASMLGLVVWSALIAPLPLLALACLVSGPSIIWAQLSHAGAGLWAAATFMGYGNTVLGFGGWAWLIQQHGAGKVAPMSLMVPVFGMVASGLYFHETFSPLKLLGAGLVFLGLLLHVFGGPLWLRWQRKKNAQTV